MCCRPPAARSTRVRPVTFFFPFTLLGGFFCVGLARATPARLLSGTLSPLSISQEDPKSDHQPSALCVLIDLIEAPRDPSALGSPPGALLLFHFFPPHTCGT